MPKKDPDKRAEYQHRWYEAHKEKCIKAAHRIAYAKQRYAANREAFLAENKRRYRANRKYHIDRARRYAAQHPNRSREHYAANKARYAQLDRAWRKANPERSRIRVRKRRARLRMATGTHTVADIQSIWKRQKGRCAGCKSRLKRKPGPRHAHVDHIQALVNGGSNSPENLQLLCRGCNLRKNAMDEYEWAQAHGMLFPK